MKHFRLIPGQGVLVFTEHNIHNDQSIISHSIQRLLPPPSPPLSPFSHSVEALPVNNNIPDLDLNDDHNLPDIDLDDNDDFPDFLSILHDSSSIPPHPITENEVIARNPALLEYHAAMRREPRTAARRELRSYVKPRRTCVRRTRLGTYEGCCNGSVEKDGDGRRPAVQLQLYDREATAEIQRPREWLL